MREVQLTYKQGEVAPATTSDLVVMKHGKTLKEELSTNSLDRFSREVTVTSSMEKIVDGACDGAYESLVFKGRSLVNFVNISKKPTNIIISNGVYTVTTGDTSVSWGSGSIPIHGLNSNKKYVLFNKGITTNMTRSPIGSVLAVYERASNRGVAKCGTSFDGFVAFSIPSGFDASDLVLRIHATCEVEEKGTTSVVSPMILEYQEGMENWDIPYFEGLCDVKMPVLRNAGKNLFDGNFTVGGLSTTNGSYDASNKDWAVTDYINVSNAKGVTFSSSASFNSNNFVYFKYDKNKKFLGYIGIYDSSSIASTSLEGSVHYVRLRVPSTIPNNSKFQIEQGLIVTTYEPYKTNILHTSEEIILRSLPNGAQDTYNPLTGEYVKRVGEVVLDGSDDETWDGFVVEPSGMGRMLIVLSNAHRPSIICDKIKVVEYSGSWNNVFECCSMADENHFIIYLANVAILSEFKNKLQSNPITVQYELATPIIKKVEPKGHPFAYENGHVILESGHQGQSLLPELVYSIPASKSGVLSTASKMILIHEQRLHKLEDLLLRESVLMDYRFALSLLDEM